MKRVAIALTAVAVLSIVGMTAQRAEASPGTTSILAQAATHAVGARYGGHHAPHYRYHHGHHYRPHYPHHYYRAPVYRHYYSPYHYDRGCYRPYGSYYRYNPYGVSVYGRNFGLSIGF